jgi:hypothetical protein
MEDNISLYTPRVIVAQSEPKLRSAGKFSIDFSYQILL